MIARSAPAELVSLLEPLLEADPGGRSWLPALLRAGDRAQARLDGLIDDPGGLEIPLAVRTEHGALGAFTYPAAPPRELLGWYLDHPHELARSDGAADTSVETRVLRRALLDDDPPGARARAQDRAHELLRSSSPRLASWWRFEEPGGLEAVLATERLVLSLTTDPGALAPVTPWYPSRSVLVRDLEAVRRLAGGRAWGGLLISDGGPPPALRDPGAIAATVAGGAPHLDAAERDDLAGAYLGCLSWEQARAAVAG